MVGWWEREGGGVGWVMGWGGGGGEEQVLGAVRTQAYMNKVRLSGSRFSPVMLTSLDS